MVPALASVSIAAQGAFPSIGSAIDARAPSLSARRYLRAGIATTFAFGVDDVQQGRDVAGDLAMEACLGPGPAGKGGLSGSVTHSVTPERLSGWQKMREVPLLRGILQLWRLFPRLSVGHLG
jgi:hypothetical protein